MGVNKQDAPSGLVITVRGLPRPQPRPRWVGRRMVSTTGRARNWGQAVEKAGKEAVANAGGFEAVRNILGDRVQVRMRFRIDPRANGRSDVDNLAKLVMDRLMKVGALGGDDSRVVDLQVEKTTVLPPTLASVGTPAGAGVTVELRQVLDAPSGAQEAAGEPRPGWLVPEGGQKPEAL